MTDAPCFDDFKAMFSPDGTHHQECMDKYYDQLEKALPRQSLKDLLRQFDSYWILKAEALADAAFVHGFIVGRRMGRDLTSGSGTGEADGEGAEETTKE